MAGGQPAGPAALYAVGVTFLTLTFVAVGAVTSQLFGSRRRAVGTAGGVLGVSYVIRMIADGTQDSEWLRWASPLGWVETLRGVRLEQPAAAGAARPHTADPVRRRGGARRAARHGRRNHPRHGDRHRAPAAAAQSARFRVRERVGGLLGWGLGLLAFGFVLGAITKAFVDFIADDPDIADLMEQFGFTSMSTPIGFVASMDATCVAVVACTR